MRQGPVLEVGEHGLDDRVIPVGGFGLDQAQLDVRLSWTSLVPQRREQSGDVVGEGGLGFELLAGQPDGDVLQGA